MKIISIPEKNAVTLTKQVYTPQGDHIDLSKATDMSVAIKLQNITSVSGFTWELVDEDIQIHLKETLEIGVYSLEVSFVLDDERKTDLVNPAFAIVRGGAIYEGDKTIGGLILTTSDTELENLKAEYEEKITDLDTLRTQYEVKIHDVEESQTNIASIKTTVTSIDSDGAKQGTNANATNTAILAAINAGGGGGGMTPTQYDALSKKLMSDAILAQMHDDGTADTHPNYIICGGLKFCYAGWTTIDETQYVYWYCPSIPDIKYSIRTDGYNVGLQLYNLSDDEFKKWGKATSIVNDPVSRQSDVTAVNTKVTSLQTQVGEFSTEGETVAHKLENLSFDTTELAKVGTNTDATNTAILSAIDDIADGYAEQLKAIIGD